MFLEPVGHKMTKHVETPLEPGKQPQRMKEENGAETEFVF